MKDHTIAMLVNVRAPDELTTADVAGIIVAEVPNWFLGEERVEIIGATVDLGGAGAHLAHPGSITESWRNRSRLE